MILDKLSSIYHGWKNSLIWNSLPKELTDIFHKRLSICEDCPEFVEDNRLKVVAMVVNNATTTGTEPYFAGMKCNYCGCQTLAKISSEVEHCPLAQPKWNAIQRDAQRNIIDDGIPK